MNSKAKVYVDAIRAEVEHWPGVEVDFTDGGKHPKARFTYEGRTLFRPFSGTSTVAVARMLGDMRRTMRELGAERSSPDPKPEDDERAYAKPNDGAARRPNPVAAEPVEAKPSIAEQVAEVSGKLDLAGDAIDELAASPKREKAPVVAASVAAVPIAASKRPDIDLAWRVDFNPEKPKESWGIYPDITPEQYFRDPCPEPSVSNSLMGPLLDMTPRDAAWAHPRRAELVEGWENDEERLCETAAKRRGDIVHQLVLGKGTGFAIGDFDRWQSNDAKAFKRAAEEDGLTPVKRKEFEEAEIIAARMTERVKRILDGADYQTECVFMFQVQTERGPVWVRGMMDIWCPDRAIIIDPKITARLYDRMVDRHALDMGWDRQCALYKWALGCIFPDIAGRVEFADLMMSPDAPYVSRLWAPERAWEASSLRMAQMAIERFGEHLWRKHWPGFGDAIGRGQMPAWEDKRRTELELGA